MDRDWRNRTIETVAGLVESPGGALWIRRDSGRFEPSANWHFPPVPVSEPADSLFCAYLETKQWVVDLEEYRREPEKYEGVEMPAWLCEVPRGRLVLPLITHGRLFGFMLLLEPRSSIVLNWEVIDLLKIAGTQAASYLAQQDAAMALMVARQFESFNRMSTFVVHDLKNLVSQLSLMMRNAEKHRDNPEFQRDMIDTVNFSVQKMRLLLQKLSRSESPEHIAPLSLARLVKQAVALKAAYEPMPVLRIEDAGLQVVADAERLERVIGHLIQNAIEATPADGSVQVDLARAGWRGADPDRRFRRRHERGIHPRAPVQAFRFDQVGRHGHRCFRKPRVYSGTGWPARSEQPPAGGHHVHYFVTALYSRNPTCRQRRMTARGSQ